MAKNFNDEDDFATSIGPSATPVHLSPAKREFKPWHKPRKHWLRINQWAMESGKLIQQIGSRTTDKVLTYLTLPGTDMLDVRILCDECWKHGYKVKYLGFNDPGEVANNQQHELSISQSELAKNGITHPESFVVPDKFEALANDTKVAYQKMVDFGSFDVVNLDLCNSVAGHVPLQEQDTYFDALARLIEYQSSNRVSPWLLFITSRVDKQAIKDVALKGLLSCVSGNIVSNPSFHVEIKKKFGLDLATVKNAMRGKALPPQQLYDSFNIGLGKWLLHFLGAGQPKWTLEMLPSWCYQVNPANAVADMVSFAFKCVPIREPKIDRAGLSRSAVVTEAGVSEVKAAIALLAMVSKMENVDSLLSDDEAEMKKFVELAAELMASARYDGSAYIAEFGTAKATKAKRRIRR